MNIGQFESRKRDHVHHALDPKHQAGGLTGFDRVRLRHEALPDLDFGTDVSIGTTRWGKSVLTPFYISGMTAGHADAARINRTLATVCARRGWAMGVGSQRRDLAASTERPNEWPDEWPDEWKDLRRSAPGLSLFANLGIAQVITASAAPSTMDAIRRVVETLGAEALAIHLNALQEVLQPEGTPQFKGGLRAIERVVRSLEGTPVIVKETGSGMSGMTVRRLLECGVRAIDISGLGGTHWGRIEGARAEGGSVQAYAAQTFADWGIATVDSVRDAVRVSRESQPENSAIEIWGSGGVRSGLDAAKLLALGATQVGYAQPALAAALAGEAGLDQWMERQEFELRTALFCTGSPRISQLSRALVANEQTHLRENTSL